jgi:hypothetical protein
MFDSHLMKDQENLLRALYSGPQNLHLNGEKSFLTKSTKQREIAIYQTSPTWHQLTTLSQCL